MRSWNTLGFPESTICIGIGFHYCADGAASIAVSAQLMEWLHGIDVVAVRAMASKARRDAG
jgi:hypothetical protein